VKRVVGEAYTGRSTYKQEEGSIYRGVYLRVVYLRVYTGWCTSGCIPQGVYRVYNGRYTSGCIYRVYTGGYT